MLKDKSDEDLESMAEFMGDDMDIEKLKEIREKEQRLYDSSLEGVVQDALGDYLIKVDRNSSPKSGYVWVWTKFQVKPSKIGVGTPGGLVDDIIDWSTFQFNIRTYTSYELGSSPYDLKTQNGKKRLVITLRPE